jgi:DNA repair exonuclease SbcCD nuclease subunit
VKLAIVADVHLDQAFAWAGPDVGRRLRQAIRDALRSAVTAAAEAGVEAFCVAGDLFEDDRYAPDTPEFLRALFAELAPTPVLLAPGNHDPAVPASPYLTVEWTPNVHVFADPELSAFRFADGLIMWGAGHDRPAYTPGFFDSGFHVSGSGIHLALFHGAERSTLRFQEEGKIPHAPFDAAQIATSGLAHAFVGHYHQPRDTDLLTYPGNLEHLAFGETGQRGLVLATVAADGTVTSERRVLARVGMYDVTVDADGCGTVDEIRARLEAKLAELPQDASVRVARLTVTGLVSGTLQVSQADLLTIPNSLDKLVIQRLELHAADDLEQIAAEPTVRGAFVRMIREDVTMGDEDRELVLTAGLRALSGRGDLQVV